MRGSRGLLVSMNRFDVVVVGGGLRGMRAALSAAAERPGATVLCVEAAPHPGDDVRSQRSNGFVCELGPFAFTREDLDALLAPLAAPPRVVSARAAARTGWLFDGEERRPLRVEPEPLSFPSGCEDLVQAYRRQLGEVLRLGRAVTSVAPRDDGALDVWLGGEAPTQLVALEVVLATPDRAAARALAPFEPELPQVAARIGLDERAFVWFGGVAAQAPELSGYGVLPHPSLATDVAELIFCTEVFDRRAMPGRTLVRAEALRAQSRDDAELTRAVEAELRRWTDVTAAFGFSKVHRFHVPSPDGDAAECRARIAEIVRRVSSLSEAP